MKIFWSWQSDHDGKVSHYFVRDALNDAIKTLKAESNLEEPTEADRRTQLHLDHDTKGNTGWVDITQSIFEKIEASAVFIADVTPVAFSPSKKDGEGKEVGLRPIMNPNVAIELGYALKALDWTKIIPVMNTAYGSVERMPFDIDRTRRWAVTYKLNEGATAAEIKAARTKLAGDFVKALRGFLTVPEMTKPFPERKPASSDAFFFPPRSVLGAVGETHDRIEFYLEHVSAFYLRVIPTVELPRPLRENDLLQKVHMLGNFGKSHGGTQRTNEDGACIFDMRGNGTSGYLDSVSQAFRNGELWGVNVTVLRQGQRDNRNMIYQNVIEQVYLASLPLYLEFIQKVSGVSLPVTVEAGMVGVKGWELIVATDYGPAKSAGTMYDNVKFRRLLKSDDAETQRKFLLEFFEAIFDQVGVDRPRLNDFP